MITNRKKIELRKFKNHYLQGVSIDDLAFMFNINVKTVKYRIYKIRKGNDTK